MCSPDGHPFFWAISRFVWCSCNSYCWRVRRGKTKTDISRCKRGYQPGGGNCWRLSTFNSVLQIQKTYRPSLSRLNSKHNKSLPHVRVNIFKTSNEHRKSNRYNNYSCSYKRSIKLNKSYQTQDISPWFWCHKSSKRRWWSCLPRSAPTSWRSRKAWGFLLRRVRRTEKIREDRRGVDGFLVGGLEHGFYLSIYWE